jgi:glutamate/tyrosine decarboxylase-like PLP-dependent enzyme
MINPAELDVLRTALEKLQTGFADLPRFESTFDADAVSEVMQQVAVRMQDNYPYYHPLYAGQMLKPPHPVARIAYALSLWINPNNHALDGGRASSALEKECITELGNMFGWDAPLGHLTGGGTMANLEALWIARRLQPGKRIVASDQSHYTHKRICEVLGIPFTAVRCTPAGHMDLSHLDELLDHGDVGTVVGRGLWRLLHARKQAGRKCARCFRSHERCRLYRHRPAQTRPAALWLRLRAVPRPDGGPLLQARFTIHLLQLR